MNEKQISLLAAFAAAGVEFAVVGGLAVNAHGYARATHDLDIFIRPTEENARAAFGALLALGVPLEGLEPGDLLDDEENLRFGPGRRPHRHSCVDWGDGFRSGVAEPVEAVVEGVPVPFISKMDLIENKRQVGRLRDLADVEELERVPEKGEDDFEMTADEVKKLLGLQPHPREGGVVCAHVGVGGVRGVGAVRWGRGGRRRRSTICWSGDVLGDACAG